MEHRGFLRQQYYSVWYHTGECMSLSKPLECTKPRMSPHISYGLWENQHIVTCNKCASPVWGADIGRGCVYVTDGNIWSFSILSIFGGSILS
jgi:hypothetical protein